MPQSPPGVVWLSPAQRRPNRPESPSRCPFAGAARVTTHTSAGSPRSRRQNRIGDDESQRDNGRKWGPLVYDTADLPEFRVRKEWRREDYDRRCRDRQRTGSSGRGGASARNASPGLAGGWFLTAWDRLCASGVFSHQLGTGHRKHGLSLVQRRLHRCGNWSHWTIMFLRA